MVATRDQRSGTDSIGGGIGAPVRHPIFFENFAVRFPEKEIEEKHRSISDRVAVDFGAGLGARVHGRYPM
jgi:hypothetical protein